MFAMHTDTRFPVEGLWVDSVSTVSVDADWDTLGGEDREGFMYYEAPDCPTCGTYAVWDDDEHRWTCPDAVCEQHGGEIEDESEGPMMNYYYPVDLRRMGDDPHKAASAIRDLPLCVIEFQDGSYALALTGGGMDLSWEICEAFTRLGYLPPVTFAALPGMAGYPRNDAQRYVIRACICSAEVAEGWARSTRERLIERYGSQD